MRLTSTNLKNINLLKHYRIIRKWACKTSDLKEADLELLIYLESLNHFTTQKYHIYKVSTKCSQLISRIYRIMLGEEDMPTKKIDKNNKYIYKVTSRAVKFVNMDKLRTNGI